MADKNTTGKSQNKECDATVLKRMYLSEKIYARHMLIERGGWRGGGGGGGGVAVVQPSAFIPSGQKIIPISVYLVFYLFIFYIIKMLKQYNQIHKMNIPYRFLLLSKSLLDDLLPPVYMSSIMRLIFVLFSYRRI